MGGSKGLHDGKHGPNGFGVAHLAGGGFLPELQKLGGTRLIILFFFHMGLGMLAK